MKKIILVLFLSILLSACSPQNNPDLTQVSPTPEVLADSTSAPKPQNTVEPTSNSKKTFSYSTIQEAVDKSIALECKYSNEGGLDTIVNLKGHNFLFTQSAGIDNQTHAIFKDNHMWIWNNTNPKGTLVNFDNPPKGVDFVMKGKVIRSEKDIIATLETENQQCHPKEIDDQNFLPPSNIKF